MNTVMIFRKNLREILIFKIRDSKFQIGCYIFQRRLRKVSHSKGKSPQIAQKSCSQHTLPVRPNHHCELLGHCIIFPCWLQMIKEPGLIKAFPALIYQHHRNLELKSIGSPLSQTIRPRWAKLRTHLYLQILFQPKEMPW